MSTKIGHFEILSELAKSATGAVYKANDPQSGQTIALKAIQLSAFGESAGDLEQSLLEEVETTKPISSQNITPIYGAGEIDGQFCAAMEYVQGNSIATMLARKEGFSIWDLLDIGRQACNGLDHAHNGKVYHYSLEPAKIMCGWDGTVKILGFGVSSVGRFTEHISGGIPLILHYMSPEQVHGEGIDNRSNLFSLGAMFYEMVTDCRAFNGADAAAVRRIILEDTPAPPRHLSPKVHPLLSDLIMKALHKDPAMRYQSGRELLDDLEKCKESKPQVASKPAVTAKTPAVPDKVKAAVQPKFVAPSSPKAAAAPARAKVNDTPEFSTPQLDTSSHSAAPSVKPTVRAAERPSANTSPGTDQLEVETFAPDAPKIAVDPMMAEGRPAGGGGTSFSEISELPPLEEVFIATELPTPSAQEPAPAPAVFKTGRQREEKPKIQPREVAQKAIREIRGVPPRLMLYSVVGAVVLILTIAVAIAFHVYSANSDDDGGTSRATAVEEVQPAKKHAVSQNPRPAEPAAAEPQPAEVSQPEPEVVATTAGKGRTSKRKAPAAPVVIPGQMAVDSTPQGAQVQVDGASDPSWTTPLTISSLQPGRHSISLSKAGYSTDTRTVDVTSGSKSTMVIHLTQLMATLSVGSNPKGANIYVDGRDVGKTTPAQVSVDKGQHVILLRKLSYLDETATAQFIPGQTVNFSPTLRSLGNVDNIRTVGKMKKLFGGNGGQPGQVTISIRTQPKGAQIAVNQRMLDKGSPVEVMLDPGNYVIDITLSGYAPIHKVVTVEKGSKIAVDETLQPQ